ncbi:leucine--tRNA ligase [Candidatus Uhrbacteria bacterium]|nr:leucine--tRNA ligase [Candidatus Uhrbacteria bacterium]
MPYNHQQIEKKWQKKWDESDIFRARDDSDKPKYYCLIEFPYPSGAGLHMGHPRSYTAMDVIARKRRMEGFNVLYPIGWDAFGLPAENYAIKTGRKPQDVTAENIATFKRQLKSFGLSFDWSREVNTTDPEYYKWTQWMFLEFFKAGLAYKKKMPINWCVSCKIGLANEEVVDGKCERCGGPTEKREKEQWMIAITKYADRLLEDLETVDYLEKIKTQQKNWIGRSEGAEISFVIVSEIEQSNEIASVALLPRNDNISVFTTRPDTILGATFLVISPELAQQWIADGWMSSEEVKGYIEQALKRDNKEREAESKEKTGVPTGVFVINPANKEKIPVWVADYVLGEYGTGAVMAVPQHDDRDREFAEKFSLPIADRPLISFDESIEKSGGKKTVQYKLRDWVFSRQRYWGEPIPLVWCEECAKQSSSLRGSKATEAISEIAASSLDKLGTPRNDMNGWISVPDDQLPIVLPEVEKYEPTETGESPLAAIHDWVNTKCPKCGGKAKRETDTMPNWAGSSWYFLAYIMKGVSSNYQLLTTNYQSAFNHWMPVDWYNGGMEHTTLHLLYSRFWNKFLFDRGHVPVSEPYAKRTSHGLVLAEDGTKMSKSKGNAVNPDEMINEYGADSVRLYELFMGPFGEPVPWSTNGLVGMRRFLEKVVEVSLSLREASKASDEAITRLLHQTIKKVTDDIEHMRFNTAISQMMIFVNVVKENESISKENFTTFLRLLCPFAPHLSNELYEQLGGTELLEQQIWPTHDSELAKEQIITIAVQVNGKLRGIIDISPDAEEESVKQSAIENEHVKKYVEGKSVKKIVYVKNKIVSIVV